MMINFTEIFAGTYHILVVYLGFLLVITIMLTLVKPIDQLIIRLNAIHISKDQRIFRLNYLVLIGILVIIGITMVLIGWLKFRMTPEGFQIFAFFSFIAMPIGLGFLIAYSHILKVGEYQVGNGILLLFIGVMMAMAGVHIHDVIWCGVATDWYQTEQIGGYDLALFYTTFRILDATRWDYRTFGLYMCVRVIIEITTGILVYVKFVKINCQYKDTQQITFPFPTLLCMLAAAILFGIVEFIFDYPWIFTELQYYANLFLGIPIVVILFILAGRHL
jgi:hypothetical protein